jgi:acetyl-CoA carboxylase biotin carboxyl carrier protein
MRASWLSPAGVTVATSTNPHYLLLPVDLKEIRSLVDLMKKNGIAVFKLEREEFKITLKTEEATRSVSLPPGFASLPSAPAALPSPAANLSAAQATGEKVEVVGGPEIKSPMVGTFYSSPSPEAAPFVKVGQSVTPDTVVCIVEAMKVMNEVKAEVAGVIAEICAENGKPVQFGQSLFRLQ